MKRWFVGILCLFKTVILHAEVFSMEEYLKQVKQDNFQYQGSELNQKSIVDKRAESDLMSAFTIIGDYHNTWDKKLPNTPSMKYDRLDTQSYSVGLKKDWNFGLESAFSYDINSTNYLNPNSDDLGREAYATPVIKLSQSMWKNAWGRLIQSNIEASKSVIEAEKYNTKFMLDSIEQNAIEAYWMLVVKREIVKIQELAVNQAQSIYEYVNQRTKMNLGEYADLLLAKTSLESKKFDLQSAKNNELFQLRIFNKYRNRPPYDPSGELSPISWDFISNFNVPENRKHRADVVAAKYEVLSSKANYRAKEENNKPSLNAYASYALNGRDESFGSSLSDSYTAHRPTITVGATFSMPLEMTLSYQARHAAQMQALAADLIYKQKVEEQEADWQDLKEKIVASQKQINLSLAIEEAQKAKFEYEQKRLKEGRTSTYQVLEYEKQYTEAKLSRIQIASEMISLLSKVRLYSSTLEIGE